MTVSPRRRAGHDFGLAAEFLAALWLQMKFYRVLARRYRAAGGEVDLIARRGDTIVFVEVKARPTLDAAQRAITPGQRRRIAQAASHWVARNGWAANHVRRADAVFLAPWHLPRHLADAFALDLE